jgi:hypothetical protein
LLPCRVCLCLARRSMSAAALNAASAATLSVTSATPQASQTTGASARLQQLSSVMKKQHNAADLSYGGSPHVAALSLHVTRILTV